jgi:pimeloyl-ACP methyl ester carboxylesterase
MQSQPIFKSAAGRNSILTVYDSILSQWPLAYETQMIPTRRGNTHVIACGDKSAPPLILMHGSSSNSLMWIGDVGEFCRHYRVYALDILGEPGKSEAVRHELTGPAYVEWLEDILKTLNLKQATFLGISLGAWMALKFATAHPDRVEKLVLLCPSGIGPQKSSFLISIILLMFMGEWGKKRLLRKINGKSPIPEEAIAYSKFIGAHFNPIMAALPIFSDTELTCLQMPLLVIVGARDVLLHSKKTAARLTKLLPQAAVKLLPEAGHVLINMGGEIMKFLLNEAGA